MQRAEEGLPDNRLSGSPEATMGVLGLSSAENWAVFVLYIIVSTNHAMLTTASQDEKKYKFDATSAVLLAETLKLMAALGMLLVWERRSLQNLLLEIFSHKKVMALYTVPAFLYSLANNLSFINLSLHDPTTFIILMQLRIVLSGVIYQILFKRKLSHLQWLSLIVLTCGCIIKHIDFSATTNREARTSSFNFPFTLGLLFLLSQSFMALFAGVYTEYLLKGRQSEVNIWIQNVYMYSHSILWNLFFSIVGSGFTGHFWETSESVLQPKVLAVVVNSALLGIITSVFLKTLNSIVKSFAIGVEMIVMPIIGNALFGIPVSIPTVVSIIVVIIAIQIYSRNPLVNSPIAQK